MRHLRISIAGLMALVLFAAVAFAALKHPSPVLASALYTLDAGLVCVAVLGALFRRGRSRRAWAGFAVFAVAYLYVVFATYPLIAPSSLSTWGLSYLDARRGAAVTATGDYLAINYLSSPTAPVIDPSSLPFFQVGHCLVALVAGLAGAGVAVLIGREDAAPAGRCPAGAASDGPSLPPRGIDPRTRESLARFSGPASLPP